MGNLSTPSLALIARIVKEVDFENQMKDVFSVDDEADFCVESGLWLHTITCECGAEWYVGISGINLDKE